MSATPIKRRHERPSSPCPVCGSHSKGCSTTVDDAHFCRGDARPGWKKVGQSKDGDFGIYRDESTPPPERNGQGHHGNGRSAKPIPQVDWVELNAEFVANLTPEDAADLAGTLQLPVVALGELEVGVEWHGETRVYTFPERDGHGNIIGISRRYPDAKRAVPGSRRGLTIPESFRGRGGPVYIVEGATDTIALACCGLATVGRPSNVGGVEHLAELLAGSDRSRDIVVVGENDKKPDGKWPGQEGAESVAKALAEKLGRPVRVAMPPDGDKDSRDRIADLIAGAGEVLDLAAVGREFVATLVFAEGPKSRFEFISAEAFDDGDYRPTLLIDQVFVRNEAGIIAGSSKTLKTSLGIDAAISIASGSPFLGTFRVPVKLRVSYVSGESGRPTTQETARRISREKGFELRSLGDWLNFNFACPTLSDPGVMAEFATELSRTRRVGVFSVGILGGQ